MSSIIRPEGIKKKLKNIITDTVILQYNIGGIHGKSCLRKLENFYDVLIGK